MARVGVPKGVPVSAIRCLLVSLVSCFLDPGVVRDSCLSCLGEHGVMLRRPRLRICFFLEVTLSVGDPALAAAPHSIIATVQPVADADSITALSDNNTKLRICLLGIDAPEVAHDTKPGQPYGEEARDYLDHLIGGKPVQVEVCGRDQYNRILAILWDGPVNTNLRMAAMGDAEVYRGAPCVVQCKVPGTVVWANPQTPRAPSRWFPTGGDEPCLSG